MLSLQTPKRTIANYMFWRAARASLGYFTEAARKIQLEYSKNITGTKEEVKTTFPGTLKITFVCRLRAGGSARERPAGLSPLLLATCGLAKSVVRF